MTFGAFFVHLVHFFRKIWQPRTQAAHFWRKSFISLFYRWSVYEFGRINASRPRSLKISLSVSPSDTPTPCTTAHAHATSVFSSVSFFSIFLFLSFCFFLFESLFYLSLFLYFSTNFFLLSICLFLCFLSFCFFFVFLSFSLIIYFFSIFLSFLFQSFFYYSLFFSFYIFLYFFHTLRTILHEGKKLLVNFRSTIRDSKTNKKVSPNIFISL
jgi:hypothetical protein